MDGNPASASIEAGRREARHARRWLLDQIGGPARIKVILILASVLALDGADKGAVSATVTELRSAFHVGDTEIGLLVTASTFVGAAFTIPIGALTDRVKRTRLLAGSVLLWSIAMMFAGGATSYVWLLLSRIALGAVTATAGPTLASLAGDFFPMKDRARMYGFILAGELVGTGAGFVISGLAASVIGWRAAFWWLVFPSLGVAYIVWRLAEPARGGQSRLEEGETEIHGEDEVGDEPADETFSEEDAIGRGSDRANAEGRARPYPEQVLTEDPAGKSLWWAVKYVLRVRTDVVIIVASALGYFYFAGLRTFAISFAQGHYGITKGEASSFVIIVGAGALAGVYGGGRITDRLRDRGVLAARIVVPCVVLFTVPLFLAPAFWLTELWAAIPLLTIGAALLGAANPPQDAARLDVIHPHLWGRSEGVRTALRGFLEAAAPVTFGWVSDNLFGGKYAFGGTGSQAGQTAMGYTFMLFLIVLVLAGAVVLVALRTYPRDVATAAQSFRNTSSAGEPSPPRRGPVR